MRSGESPCSAGPRRRSHTELLLGVLAVVLLWGCGLGASLASASVPSTAIRYTYTPDSQLSSVIKPEAEYGFYTWDAAGNLSSVAKKSSTKLSIIQLEPSKGAVGETVDIWGTGFSTTPSNDTVKFHGTAATVTAATAYTLAVKVPSGATTGTVTVQTTTEGPVTSSQTFTVASAVGAPTVTSLSISLAEAGSTVTVSGTNFESTAADDIVRVNQDDAEVVSASSASIKFKVPSSTSGGHVSVTTPQGSVSGPDLYVPPEGIAASKVGATERIPAGKSVTIKLSVAETVGLVLFDASEGQHVAVIDSEQTFRGSVAVYSPQGVQLNQESFDEKEVRVDRLSLPTTGTYMVVVKPEGTGTGSVSLSTETDITGSITPSTKGAEQPVSITVPYQRALYSIAGTTGENVSVKISGVSFSGEGGRVELVNAQGGLLGSQTFNKSEGGFINQVKLPASGATLIIEPTAGATGSLTLTAYEDPDVTGTINPSAEGETKTITTTIPGQNARISFSGTEGERVSFILSEGTYPRGYYALVNPEGKREDEGTLRESYTQFISPVKLAATGTYTFLIEPTEGYTGHIKLAAYSVTNTTGSITPSTEGAKKEVAIKTPGQEALYTFSGTANEKVAVNITGVSFSPEGGEVAILNSEGSSLGFEDFRSTGSSFLPQVKLPATGTYTLAVKPFGASTGSLTLTAYEDPDVTGTISPSAEGETKTITTTIPGQNARISFSGTEGERVSFILSEGTYPRGYYALVNPEGKREDEGTLRESYTQFISPVKLAATGTYTFLIEPTEGYTGHIKLAAYSVTNTTGSITPSTEGAKKEVAIKTPGQEALYTFSGTANEKVAVNITGVSFSPEGGEVAILNSEGSSLGFEDFRSTGSSFLPQVKLPATGTYTLAVKPFGASTGSLTLTAYEDPDVTGTITPTTEGESKVVTISIPGQYARITFSGTSGKTVTLKARESTITRGYIFVLTPAGERRDETTFGGTGASIELSLSETGTYTIVLEPEGAETGTVKLTAYLGSHPGGIPIRLEASQNPLLGGTITPLQPAFPSSTPLLARPASLPRTSNPRRAAKTTPLPQSKTTSSGRQVVRRLTDGEDPRPAARRRAAAQKGVGEHRSVAAGSPIPRAARTFRPGGPPAWNPSPGRGWETRAPMSPWASASPLRAPGGTSALSGQVLAQNGLPIAGVRVALEGTYTAAKTDEAGRFLLSGVPAGHQVLVVEGEPLPGHARYGTYEMGVDIAADKTTVLPYTVWLTPLDPAGDHRIASPTGRETRITTPQIPGLEVRLPAGTVIHDAAGRVVRKLNITAIPVDRPPFPLPFFTNVPLYFTVQPGRAYLSKGAEIVYPNYNHLPAGQRVDFWNYDPSGRGWYIYGEGTVTPNRKQVVPDPGVRVWEFTGAMITHEPKRPGKGTGPGAGSGGGDPVDLGNGLFNYRRTDLVIPDTTPIVIERTYRQADSNSYSFGVGTTSLYDLRLWSENNYHEADLVMPDGGTVLYKRTSPGEGYIEAEYKATETPSAFYNSTIKWDPTEPGWELTLTNGTTYIFGELAPLEAIRNKQGQQLTITRSEGQRGNITQITSPHGRWARVTYNSSNDITEIKDNSGRTLKYAYNKAGLLESATDPASRTTKYEYDTAGDMTSITDPRGNTYLKTEYNSNDMVSKQTLANGGVYEFSYTLGGSGNVESATETEPRESKRKVTFNANELPTSETVGLGSAIEQKTTFERQAGTGFLLSSTDARSRKTAYEYDSYGNITSITHLAGTGSAQTYKYAYEPDTNELTKETDPLGHSTSYEYNSLGERTAKKDALGHTTHYEYNGDGQPTIITDPLGHKTTIAYELGAPVSVTDPLGRTTKQFVDAAGRVLSTTAPGGQRTLYEYNNDNQITKMTDPLADVTSYEYDADGDLTATTEPLKHKSTYAYTKMDLLESEEDPLEKKTTAAYDTEGNLIELTDRRGKVDKFIYDALNRLTESKYGVSGETAESTIKYEYDNGNRLTKVIDSVGGTYTPEYDELNRLKSLATPQGTIKYEYDEANRRTSMTVPGQEALKYTYDEANRLKELKRGTQAVSFAYNEDNLPTTTTLPDGDEEQYGYDEANELTSIAYKKGSTTLGELDYAYDLDGRKEAVWGSYARTALPEAFSSAKYNADNEQTERGSKKLSYDADGHMTSDGTNEYTWNTRGQLTGITGGTKASFSYSPFGQRVSRILSGTTTELLYDGPNVVQEIQSGKVTANLLTGLMPSNVFTRTTSKATENLLTDRLGSTIALANSSGSVETTYTYDPFGATTKEGATSESTMQYAGQENDGDGLYYDRARYYSSAAARFISQDPLGQVEGPNLYEYTGDNPLNATDPLGTKYESTETAPKGLCEAEDKIYEGTGYEQPSCGPAEVPGSVEQGLCELGASFIPTPGGPVVRIVAGRVEEGVCERIFHEKEGGGGGGGSGSGPGSGSGGSGGGGGHGKGPGLR